MKKYLLLFIVIFACQHKSKDYFELLSENDKPLAAPIEGDWLHSHKEKGQTLDQFKKSNPIKPSNDCNVIYLKPFGNFDSLQTKQIEITSEYLNIFFQTEIEILRKTSINIVPKTARRKGFENNEQLLASYILDSILKKEKHKNKIALMAITNIDLYPKPEWNYVFGLASYKDRVGVTSIFRFQDATLIKSNFNLCLSRLLKISSHEIGHMFGLHHCIMAKCVMNGTNNIDETDHAITRLCSNCQRKIDFTFQTNHEKRLDELALFFKKYNLIKDLELINLDIDLVNTN